MYMIMCVPCMCVPCLRRPELASGPGMGVRDGCELPCALRTDLEQPVLLTVEAFSRAKLLF